MTWPGRTKPGLGVGVGTGFGVCCGAAAVVPVAAGVLRTLLFFINVSARARTRYHPVPRSSFVKQSKLGNQANSSPQAACLFAWPQPCRVLPSVRELNVELAELVAKSRQFLELGEIDTCFFLLLGQSLAAKVLPSKTEEDEGDADA